MTSQTSAAGAQTIPQMPRGKKADVARTDVHGATPVGPTTFTQGSGSAAETLTNDPATGPKLAHDHGGQEQCEVTSSSAPDTKLDRLLGLLRSPEGTTLADMCVATGWQAHSVRGALAGALKRKGHVISSEKLMGARRYRIEVAS